MDITTIDKMIERIRKIGAPGTPKIKPPTSAVDPYNIPIFVGRLLRGGRETVQAVTYWTYQDRAGKKSYWEIVTFDFETKLFKIRRKWGKGNLARVSQDGLVIYNYDDYSSLSTTEYASTASGRRSDCYEMRHKHGYDIAYSATHADFERGIYPRQREEFK